MTSRLRVLVEQPTRGKRWVAVAADWPGLERGGKTIVLFVADRDIRIVTEDGELLRQLVLDPTRDYQRQSA